MRGPNLDEGIACTVAVGSREFLALKDVAASLERSRPVRKLGVPLRDVLGA